MGAKETERIVQIYQRTYFFFAKSETKDILPEQAARAKGTASEMYTRLDESRAIIKKKLREFSRTMDRNEGMEIKLLFCKRREPKLKSSGQSRTRNGAYPSVEEVVCINKLHRSRATV
ncbi:hypothetical protein EVAR_61633_1 [Eumeta japonica]|uniref:Uncharacterized protein n=1 Tax=Eumeta variegata TaxID=151549 RepID=A0A4C1Z9X8_EUMVA|nr:hypothetical protein EVAR_61633_1 [Eumeta japonica]